jgi:uncharacterized membrane protein
VAKSIGPAASPAQPGGFRRLWRTLKELFHEAVGAIFAVLALAWLNALLRSYNRDTAHWLIATAAGVVALFLFLAISSFRKAKKVKQGAN